VKRASFFADPVKAVMFIPSNEEMRAQSKTGPVRLEHPNSVDPTPEPKSVIIEYSKTEESKPQISAEEAADNLRLTKALMPELFAKQPKYILQESQKPPPKEKESELTQKKNTSISNQRRYNKYEDSLDRSRIRYPFYLFFIQAPKMTRKTLPQE
jgi:hypothetical protein